MVPVIYSLYKLVTYRDYNEGKTPSEEFTLIKAQNFINL